MAHKNEPSSHKGKTSIWLTPKDIIDQLGPFDLDPCAAFPRPWPTAYEHYVTDGLERTWHDYVWLNPPYGNETALWLDKLVRHGNGIALVAARTDTRWFTETAFCACVTFFHRGRIDFCRPDGTVAKGHSTCGSVFFAFGDLARDNLLNSGLPGIYYNRYCVKSL